MKPTAADSENQKDQDEFYKDLDEKKAHSSCCSFPTLVIFFVIILVLAIAILFFLYYQITHGGSIFDNSKKATAGIEFSQKINDIKPTETGTFQIILSSDDLSNLLNSGLTAENFVLKDIRTSIGTENIQIYGTLIKPMSSKVVITVVPKVSNGKLALNVSKASFGKLNLTGFIAAKLSKTATNLLNQKMAVLYKNYEVESVSLEIDKMLIMGKLKK